TSDNGNHPLTWAIDADAGLEITYAYYEYAVASGATPAVRERILKPFKAGADDGVMPYYTTGDDPYRSYMFDGHYTWGSNSAKCRWGAITLMALHLGVNPAHDDQYREI